jgi:hypothetical protein
MMAIAHRPMWRAAAWAAVATSGAWALIGFALGSAHSDPASYSICAALAAIVAFSTRTITASAPASPWR